MIDYFAELNRIKTQGAEDRAKIESNKIAELARIREQQAAEFARLEEACDTRAEVIKQIAAAAGRMDLTELQWLTKQLNSMTY